MTVTKPLLGQMADAGYSAADITYLALSHYHYDHTGNANAFAGATWLVRQVERDATFAEKPPAATNPASYAALKNSNTVILKSDEHDVFGEVAPSIMKLAAGHTPGHQVLYVKLPKTGGVVLSGDLYHFPEARTLKRVATVDATNNRRLFRERRSKRLSRRRVHNCGFNTITLATLGSKKSPDYYQ